MLQNLKILKLPSGFRVFSRSFKFQSRNPREPHFPRKRMLEVCKPVFLPEIVPEYLTCKETAVTKEEPHPYDVILCKELKEKIDSSKMILVYHVNSITNEEKNTIYRTFFKEDLQFHMYDTDVMQLAFDETKYQALYHLFHETTGLVFSPEIAISNALKANKQLTEKVFLLAGVIEDRLYSKTNLTEINQIFKRNIHGEMVQNIRAPMTNIYRSLNHPMNLLSHYLKQISKKEE